MLVLYRIIAKGQKLWYYPLYMDFVFFIPDLCISKVLNILINLSGKYQQKIDKT